MSDLQDYKKYAVLYVDDEEKSLKSFARAFSEQFRILTAPNAEEGFRILQEHKDDIGVLMTDQRMPGEKGSQFLERARQLCPRVVRVLATAYSDLEAVVSAVNSGAIYKYVNKPWDPPQLEITLKRGLEFYTIQRERDQLLREKMASLHHIMIADRIVSLGLLAAGMSHHIRNSLVAVKTFLDLAPSKLAEEGLDMNKLHNPEFWKDYYQNVQSQVERINNLLKELWLASEKAPVHFADEVKVDEVLGGLIAELQPALDAKKIRIDNQISSSLPSLLADRPKFARLFELLLKDELASLPDGSRITLTARDCPATSTSKRELEVEIRDDGPGLSEESLRLVFDPFVARSESPQEYGISLMACYFIVHHHGGKIEALRAEPHGTIFRIRLPVNPNQLALIKENREILQKMLVNDAQWENLISTE